MTTVQQQPRRRLPRFSLITLLVAVNVAGVLVWANVRVHSKRSNTIGYTLAGRAVTMLTIKKDAGWPFTSWSSLGSIMPSPTYHWLAFLANFALSACLVVVAATLTEFLIRKFRKAKRHDG